MNSESDNSNNDRNSNVGSNNSNSNSSNSNNNDDDGSSDLDSIDDEMLYELRHTYNKEIKFYKLVPRISTSANKEKIDESIFEKL